VIPDPMNEEILYEQNEKKHELKKWQQTGR
jgi:hypothetical protein